MLRKEREHCGGKFENQIFKVNVKHRTSFFFNDSRLLGCHLEDERTTVRRSAGNYLPVGTM
jgi:hypothetical protein